MDPSKIKIHVIAELPKGASGGGMGFLQGLAAEIQTRGQLAPPEEADIFLFNSHHHLERVGALADAHPDKPFLHRVDGPMSVYRNVDDARDQLVLAAHRWISDGTLFQSQFSRQKNAEIPGGISDSSNRTWQALNAPDSNWFFPAETSPNAEKTRIIITSWSDAMNKGFPAYQWLDENLDFSRFEIQFIGNSPIQFQNIQMRPPADRKGLGEALRASHIYLTASERDPCSNSLIEAIHTEIPVIALNDGGHTEICGKRGHLFQNVAEIPAILEKIQICSRVPCWLPDMSTIADQYLAACAELHEMGVRTQKRGKKLVRFQKTWRLKQKIRGKLGL